MIRSLKDQGPSISEISRRLLQKHHDLHRRMNRNGVKVCRQANGRGEIYAKIHAKTHFWWPLVKSSPLRAALPLMPSSGLLFSCSHRHDSISQFQ